MSYDDACLFASEVCLTDVASCGCCLMQKQMWKMETFFNMSLNELERGLGRAHAVLNNIRGETAICSNLVWLYLAFKLQISLNCWMHFIQTSLNILTKFKFENRLLTFIIRRFRILNEADSYGIIILHTK